MTTTPTRAEIVFFDVETTSPSQSAAGRWWLLEFGAILVCPRKLVEVGSYETLIRPGDLSAVSRRFTDVDAQSAPPFVDVADKIFDILDGRVWAGHNIQRFDCPRIRDAFADIGRPAPEPAGVIDSLNVLAAEFGRRAGDLKMATLAAYFGIGKQKHRSLDDARMNLEVLKHCATVLLLESTLPQLLGAHQDDGNAAVTRRRAQQAQAAVAAAPAAATTTTAATTPLSKHAVQHHRTGVLSQTKLPFTPVRHRTPPRPAAPPAAPAPAATTPCGKRNSLGKVVPRAVAQQAAPLTTSSTGTGITRRPVTATTPFHMILRHSRAILR